jgi:hypothetical protein
VVTGKQLLFRMKLLQGTTAITNGLLQVPGGRNKRYRYHDKRYRYFR